MNSRAGNSAGAFAIFCLLVVRLAGAAIPFQQSVEPMLRRNCLGCHNAKLSSGGLNITPFLDVRSTSASRDGWERILVKIRTGQMPPKGAPQPPAEQLAALNATIE